MGLGHRREASGSRGGAGQGDGGRGCRGEGLLLTCSPLPPFLPPAAPGHYSYPEVRPPAPSPKPRPRPAPAPRPPRPARPARPSRPAEEGEEEPGPGPSLPQPPRRAWGNLTGELGRFRGTVQDLERHLRAHGYPLRANQTYASVARHIHEYLQRRRVAAAPVGSPAPSPRRPHPTASPDPGTWKRDSNQGIYGLSPEGVNRVAAPRHPKPEVLGSSADGSLLVSLDGLRGHFERVVLRWRPQPPAEGPGGELTVPGTTRTVSLPDLRPGTTYHVEVHGVRAGQTSKSYAFITTTGSMGWGHGITHPLPSLACHWCLHPRVPPTASLLRPPLHPHHTSRSRLQGTPAQSMPSCVSVSTPGASGIPRAKESWSLAFPRHFAGLPSWALEGTLGEGGGSTKTHRSNMSGAPSETSTSPL